MSNYCKNCYELQEQLDQLKAKNDRLKGKVKLYEEILQRNAKGFETGAQALMFADMVDGFASSIKDEKLFKLKTCLTEIKEIANDFYLDGEYCKVESLALEILQKISEVEE